MTQSIAVLVDSGSASSAFSGTGLSYSARGGVGVSGFEGMASSHTNLARRFMLGPPPGDGTGYLVVGIILFILGAPFIVHGALGGGRSVDEIWGGIAVSVIGLMLWRSYSSGKRFRLAEMNDWQKQRDYLSKAWFCHKCGADWNPDAKKQAA